MDPADLVEKLKCQDLPSEDEIEQLCSTVKEIVSPEGNVISLESPIVVCGDLHGQFYDLLEIFKSVGDCPDKKYIFLGDYGDRGYYGIETIILLFSLKAKYPQNITLLRGNHECRSVTQVYGLYDECVRKFGSVKVWKAFMDTFDCLSLCAVIDEKIFCVHGGLSPQLRSLDDVKKLDRFIDVPREGPICDLLWSDPDSMLQRHTDRLWTAVQH